MTGTFGTSIVDGELNRKLADEYRALPGLCLTARQAARLLQVESAACERALEALTRDGFLRHVGDHFHRADAAVDVPICW